MGMGMGQTGCVCAAALWIAASACGDDPDACRPYDQDGTYTMSLLEDTCDMSDSMPPVLIERPKAGLAFRATGFMGRTWFTDPVFDDCSIDFELFANESDGQPFVRGSFSVTRNQDDTVLTGEGSYDVVPAGCTGSSAVVLTRVER